MIYDRSTKVIYKTKHLNLMKEWSSFHWHQTNFKYAYMGKFFYASLHTDK